MFSLRRWVGGRVRHISLCEDPPRAVDRHGKADSLLNLIGFCKISLLLYNFLSEYGITFVTRGLGSGGAPLGTPPLEVGSVNPSTPSGHVR